MARKVKKPIQAKIAAPLFAVMVGLSFSASSPALAQDKAPDDLAREGLGKIVSALELLLLSIPTYEMPEVLPNGDIIIRRKNPNQPDSEKQGGGEGKDDEKAPQSI